jgi:hypothetical protein
VVRGCSEEAGSGRDWGRDCLRVYILSTWAEVGISLVTYFQPDEIQGWGGIGWDSWGWDGIMWVE